MKEQKELKLSLNQQAYIEAVHDLCKEHMHAHTKNIADRMGIKMASVTEAMQGLSDKGIVNYQARKNITLTKLGEDIASELDRRHAALADFFHNILACPLEKSDEIACRVEHVIDQEFIVRLTDFVEFLRHEFERCGYDHLAEFQKRYKGENDK